MRRAASQPLLNCRDGIGCRESEADAERLTERFLKCNASSGGSRIGGGEMVDITDRVHCLTIHPYKPRDSYRRAGEDFSPDKYGFWRHQQKTKAARLEKQLRAKWALEGLIDEQLNQFNAHYNRTNMGPTRLKDVAELLMPKWASPLEMAAFGWMGDWRPSSILELLRALVRSSAFDLSCSSVDQVEMDRTLSHLIKENRIEEAVIDEEMGEIQANCILHLPFGPVKPMGNRSAIEEIWSEFKKIERVIVKAQQLRFKALETIVKKVLNQSDAAEFLVTFAGIQDWVHQFGARHRLHKGSVSIPTKTLDMGTIWETSMLRRFSLLLGGGADKACSQSLSLSRRSH